MAKLEFNSKEERDASVYAYARWHAARGTSAEEFKERAYERYGGKYNQAINKAFAHSQAIAQAAKLFNRGKAGSAMKASSIPSLLDDPTGIRLNISIDLPGNTQTGRKGRQFTGLNVDIPWTLSRGDIRAAAERAVWDWLGLHYDTRQKGFPRDFKGFDITGLEGI